MQQTVTEVEYVRSRAHYSLMSDDEYAHTRLELNLKRLRADLERLMPEAQPVFTFLNALEVAINDETHKDFGQQP